ncbi:unnamed protein product, partial [Didymodactylos carnosus]
NASYNEIISYDSNSNTSMDTMSLVEAIDDYLFIASKNASSNTILHPTILDNVFNSINISINISSSQSYLMSVNPNNEKIIGAYFNSITYGSPLNQSTNFASIISSSVVAATIDDTYLNSISLLKMLIIYTPNDYLKINDSGKKNLASSIIIADLTSNNKNLSSGIPITLYFTIRYPQNITSNSLFYCSYWEVTNNSWSQDGCNYIGYNQTLATHVCWCNHMTTFALLWLPSSDTDNVQWTVRDYISMAFQALSILCFLGLIIHCIVTCSCFRNNIMDFQPNDLLPLISSGSTMILFIFYLALGITVHQRQDISLSETKCFSTAS